MEREQGVEKSTYQGIVMSAPAYDYENQRWATDPDEARSLRLKQAREELAIINQPGYWRNLMGWTPEQRDSRAADLIATVDYLAPLAVVSK